MDLLAKWNEQAAPNNNISSKTIRASKLVSKQDVHDFSEELSDSGERDQIIQHQAKKNI